MFHNLFESQVLKLHVVQTDEYVTNSKVVVHAEIERSLTQSDTISCMSRKNERDLAR